LRGLCRLRDEAESRGWPFLIVLIGMDDLPKRVKKNAQVRRRVHAWCYFKPYSLQDTWTLLAGLHPHFAALDRTSEEARAQVEFIHHTVAAAPLDDDDASAGALPGKIVPFLKKLDAEVRSSGRSVTLTLLRAVHLLAGLDEELADYDYERGFIGTQSPPSAKGKKKAAAPRTDGNDPPKAATAGEPVSASPTDGDTDEAPASRSGYPAHAGGTSSPPRASEASSTTAGPTSGLTTARTKRGRGRKGGDA
jgi:hypothetical protein